jgi:succinoglycan biosynthesis transport protein ExoP
MIEVGIKMLNRIDDIQYLKAFGFLSLKRRWKLIFTCTALSLAIASAFLVLRTPIYTASAQFLIYVREVQPGPDLVISLGRADLTQVENEIEIIRSHGTLAKVVQSQNLTDDPEFAPATPLLQGVAQWLLGAPRATADENRNRQELAIESLAKSIAIKRVGTSHTILVNVTTSDPGKSARIANGIGQVMLQARVSAEQEGDRSPLLRERLQGLGPSTYVMTPALAPDKPTGLRKIFILLGAIAAGLTVGSVLALLLDFRDKAIRTAAQVERFGLECIGAIPLLKSRRAANASRVQPGSERAEVDEFLPDALLNQTLLRTTVAIEASKVRTVGVASSVAGEGATTVARQLAQMAARSQRNVLLVEADRNETPRPLAGEASFGLAELADTHLRPFGDSIRTGNNDGPDVLSITTLKNSGGGANWWLHCDQNALGAYDLIVVSLPPLERGPEFRIARQNIDGILLVMKWGGAEVEQVERSFAVSGAVPSDFIGAVLNMIDDRMIGRFGDKLWEAEAALAARRRLFGPAMPIDPVTV